ncbi:MAG: tetratricopeptide (TPR) repeat protein [Oceanicoccus sp.]|jgi:tetratricopeptide (TPR) repeat protein
MLPNEVTKATFDEALTLINKGQLQQAADLCQRALQRSPEDVNMTALLGAVMLQASNYPAAEKHLRQAIDLAPSFAKPHEDLGILLVNLKRETEAIPLLQKAVRLDPSLELAYFNLGKALASNGKGTDADKAFEAAFELSPERKLMAMAAEHHRHGKADQAEQLYRQVLQKNPDNVDAMRMLAILACASSHFDDAERLLRKAIAIAPDFLGAYLDLGKILKDTDRLEEAIDCFRKGVAIAPNDFQPQLQLASSLPAAALNEESVSVHQRALQIKPNHPGALLGLGHALKTCGRQEEGIAAYQQCIKVKPNNGEIWWSLANLKTYSFSDEEITEMEQRVRTEGLDSSAEVNFLFALGKAFEDREDYDKSWQYYEEGNSKQRMNVGYDPVLTEIQNNDIIEVFDKDFFASRKNTGNPDPSPIFILGLPRSGSTLLEQILASHSMVEGTSELPYLGRIASSMNRNRADGVNYPQAMLELDDKHLSKLGDAYMQRAKMHRVEGKPFFIDKMPNNFPNVGLLHAMLPNAKIIDARRHPLDSCFGNFKQLYAKGQNFTYDLSDIGEYFLEYHRLMDHWNEVLPGQVLRCQYEDTVNDLEGQVKRILRFCGLPWEDACLNFHQSDRIVRTASSEQVRQPIYNKSIGTWRRFESGLEELVNVLEPVLPLYEKYMPAQS